MALLGRLGPRTVNRAIGRGAHVKAALVIVGALILGFIAAGIFLANMRFFLWVGLIALVVYAIAVFVVSRRSA